DHPSVGNIVFSIGWSHVTLGDYRKARAFTQRAYDLWSAALGKDSWEAAMALCNLGSLDDDAGRPADAAAKLRAAVDIQSRVAPDEEHTLNCLTNLGEVDVELGDLDVAEAVYVRGRDIRARTLAPDRPQWGFSWALRGRIDAARGKLDEALAAFQRAE